MPAQWVRGRAGLPTPILLILPLWLFFQRSLRMLWIIFCIWTNGVAGCPGVLPELPAKAVGHAWVSKDSVTLSHSFVFAWALWSWPVVLALPFGAQWALDINRHSPLPFAVAARPTLSTQGWQVSPLPLCLHSPLGIAFGSGLHAHFHVWGQAWERPLQAQGAEEGYSWGLFWLTPNTHNPSP